MKMKMYFQDRKVCASLIFSLINFIVHLYAYTLIVKIVFFCRGGGKIHWR